MNHELELFVCGARGTRPVSGAEYLEFGGSTTCYVVRLGDYAIVIDCGSGLYHATPILSECRQIDVLLSHLHYDHLIGLLDYSVFPEGIPVRFISNFDQWFGEESLQRFMQPPFWPFTPQFGTLLSISPPEQFPLLHGCSADFISSNHPDDAVLIRLNAAGRKLCFACDFEHGDFPLNDWVQACDLLVFDGMFSPEEFPAHIGWGHSSWSHGCRLARESHVSRLLISHHAPNRDDATLREDELRAQAHFPQTRFARQGQKLVL